MMHEGYLLDKVFSINVEYASKKEIESFFPSFIKKIENAVLKNFHWKSNQKYVLKEKKIGFNNYAISDNYYLDGYWQSYKYFENCFFDTTKEFKFNKYLKKTNLIEDYIKNNRIASIHIRRGDYLEKGIYNILDIQYYNIAISYLQKKYLIDEFLILTNDKKWFIDNSKKFHCQNFLLIEGETSSFYEMYLMTLCKWNIIANSTFSWWGGYLNNNVSREVVAPHRWYTSEFIKRNKVNMGDLYPEDWIII